VGPGAGDRPLAIVHARDEDAARAAAARVKAAISVAPADDAGRPPVPAPILEEIA
jgi:hypothetical protein